MKKQRQNGEGRSKSGKNTKKLVKLGDRGKLQDYMAAKLMVFEGALLICLLALVARIVMLSADNEEMICPSPASFIPSSSTAIRSIS